MKMIPFYLIPLFLILTVLNCNVNGPVDDNLQIIGLETSSTEAFIKVTGFPESEVRLYRDDIEVKKFILKNGEIIIADTSLLINTNYSYYARTISPRRTSNEINLTTLGTNSHNYTWQSFTFGEHSSSILTDVSIIGDEIWAVGEIYMNDSSGIADPKIFNLIHWDGNKWELRKIQYYIFCGQPNTSSIPATAIAVIDDSEIWISSANSQIAVISNKEQIKIMCLPVSVSRIWAVNINNVYTAGVLGQVGFYNGRIWQKIPTKTNLNINDIWGSVDENGNEVVLCAAYNFGSGGDKKILKIVNDRVEEINWLNNRELYTVWFNSFGKIYAGGEGLFSGREGEWKEEDLPPLFKFKVRGNGLNDVWTAGGFGFAAHFNGKSWKTYEEVRLEDGNYYGLTVLKNKVVLVGREKSKAIITIGTKE